MTTARFDDLRPGRRRSFLLRDCTEELVAHSVDEVSAVLARAEAAVAAGAWVAGWVSYEAAPAFEPAARVRETAGTPLAELPLAWFGVFDRREPAAGPSGDAEVQGWTPTISAERHAADISRIRELIGRGETYQVNHTFRLAGSFAGDSADLYARLAQAQRGGFGAHLEAGRWAVASASPELFFDWSRGRITCRPMKGTAARGVDTATDAAARDGLLASEKERAENLMIVDMVRNDLARVAVPGTVAVPELFCTERYDTVWQLTSTVTADVREGVGLVDVFAALFPCASITGAPRVSTMSIIADLETTPRGVYCGAIGFGGPGRGWVFNVGIRTVLVDRERGTAWYGTGGGITHDSTAAGEYAEALLKAEVLTRVPVPFSLLETMRWEADGGEVRSWARHLARLRSSAEYFGIPLDEDAIAGVVTAAVGRGASAAGEQGDLRVRLLVDQEGIASAEASPVPEQGAGPVRLALDDVPVSTGDPFLRHKTTRREVYDAARSRHPEADDVVLVNERGEVTETTIANIAARVDGRWLTPPLDSGCLPGVTRAGLLADGDLVEAVLTADDLRQAEALARFNAVRGWQPVEG